MHIVSLLVGVTILFLGPEKIETTISCMFSGSCQEVTNRYVFSAQNWNVQEARESGSCVLGLWGLPAWVQILPLYLTHCASLGKGSDGNAHSTSPGLW